MQNIWRHRVHTDVQLPFLSLTRGTSGLYFQVVGCSNFQTLPSQLLIGSKNVTRGKLWQNPRDKL